MKNLTNVTISKQLHTNQETTISYFPNVANREPIRTRLGISIIDNQWLEVRSPKASRRGKTKFPFSLDNGKLLTIFLNEEFTI